MYRILVVDDSASNRKVLVRSLQKDYLVTTAENGREGVELNREQPFDLILMDLNMPGCDGLEATHWIKQRFPDVTIVMLTVRDEDEKLFQAIRSGAQGYLLKSIRSWELVNLLRGAVRGEAAITPILAGRMLEEFRRLSQRPHTAPINGSETVTLTTREQDVLGLVAASATDKEIANQLSISIHTVKTHMRNILAKLQLSHRRDAALFAMREGLIAPPSDDSYRIN